MNKDQSRAPAEPGPQDAQALAEILKVLAPLCEDSRKRVLYAASAFYRQTGDYR